MYAVTANRITTEGGWMSSRQLPTFYLDPAVQGIVSEDHAERVARDILGPGEYCVTVVDVGPTQPPGTHLLDAYGDLVPEEQYVNDCEDDGTGHCEVCHAAIPARESEVVDQ